MSERAQKQIDKARIVYMGEKRKVFENINGRPPTDDHELNQFLELNKEENNLRVEAEIYHMTLANVSKLSNEIGKVMLEIMWQVWEQGLYLHMGECKNIQEWVTDHMQGYDADWRYLNGMAKVVDIIFSWVHQFELDDNHIQTSDGQKIVIEETDDDTEISLLTGKNSKGLLSKLRDNSDYFSQLDDKGRIEFIKMLVTKSRSSIVAHREETKNKERKSNLQGVKFKLTKEEKDDKIIVTIPKQTIPLTHKQYKAFVSKFADYLDFDD